MPVSTSETVKPITEACGRAPLYYFNNATDTADNIPPAAKTRPSNQ
jgi:hypothetical protein